MTNINYFPAETEIMNELNELQATLKAAGRCGDSLRDLMAYNEINKSGLPVKVIDSMTEETTIFPSATALFQEWNAACVCILGERNGYWELGLVD